MKNKSEIAAGLYVVLTVLHNAKADTGKGSMGGVPNGHLYAQLMQHYNINEWSTLISGMVGSGSITMSNHLLKITPKGEDVLQQLEAIYNKAKTKPTTHPFVATPNNGPCSSCGKSRTDNIHKL